MIEDKIEQHLRGRVKFPIGGTAHEPQGRSGVIPGPTVTVWMIRRLQSLRISGCGRLFAMLRNEKFISEHFCGRHPQRLYRAPPAGNFLPVSALVRTASPIKPRTACSGLFISGGVLNGGRKVDAAGASSGRTGHRTGQSQSAGRSSHRPGRPDAGRRLARTVRRATRRAKRAWALRRLP